MRIVKLKGGLGNQMFQYSYAKLIEKITGDIVKLDYTSFQSLNSDNIRVPRITKFNISLDAATQEDIRDICIISHNSNSLSLKYKVGIFAESRLNKKYFLEPNRAYIAPESLMSYRYFDGYWQSWRYVDLVKDEILRDFTPNYVMDSRTVCLQEELMTQNAVFVGVRRGDYSKEKSHYGSFGSDYYLSAMRYIEERVINPTYYIFSNDIPWCKENLNWDGRTVIYREQEKQVGDFEELMLMASCKHAIIINSSFHWWGAWLISGKEKTVCCPEKWWFDDKPIDIIPDDWVRIKI